MKQNSPGPVSLQVIEEPAPNDKINSAVFCEVPLRQNKLTEAIFADQVTAFISRTLSIDSNIQEHFSLQKTNASSFISTKKENPSTKDNSN